jgi:hypothetical protein
MGITPQLQKSLRQIEQRNDKLEQQFTDLCKQVARSKQDTFLDRTTRRKKAKLMDELERCTHQLNLLKYATIVGAAIRALMNIEK